MRDIAAQKSKLDPEQYQTSMSRLSLLNREVLVNVAAIIVLLIVETGIGGISPILETIDVAFNFLRPLDIAVALQAACLGTSLTIICNQFRGFLTANEFRPVISQ